MYAIRMLFVEGASSKNTQIGGTPKIKTNPNSFCALETLSKDAVSAISYKRLKMHEAKIIFIWAMGGFLYKKASILHVWMLRNSSHKHVMLVVLFRFSTFQFTQHI